MDIWIDGEFVGNIDKSNNYYYNDVKINAADPNFLKIMTDKIRAIRESREDIRRVQKIMGRA